MVVDTNTHVGTPEHFSPNKRKVRNAMRTFVEGMAAGAIKL